MRAVYKGRQANLGRDVTIKVLPETFTKGDDELNLVARFKQDACATATAAPTRDRGRPARPATPAQGAQRGATA